ncbi:aminotransferase-like domain-containing protein [Marinomonas sargassi]|nr:PLP-dependent aminotransferase family protein [Marinomonas sargassi]
MEPSLVRELLHYSQQPNIISLAGGLPDDALMPAYPDVNQLLDSRQYGASDGEAVLQQHIAQILAGRGLDRQKAVLVTNGSQQGLDIVSRSVLDNSATILTEQPTYLAACQVFRLQGANIQGVTSDEFGMSVKDFEEKLEEYKPKAVYMIPNFQNPSGHCYSLERRKEIASLLEKKNVLLIEDDPYGELCYEEIKLPPISSMLKTSSWVYLGSFSKVLWPGLRVGYMACDEELMPYFEKVKQATDLHTNRLAQMMVSHFLGSGQYLLHIAKLKAVYKKKRDAMADALLKYLGNQISYRIPAGGMFFWVRLPEGVSSMLVMERALQEQVLVLPGKPFFSSDHMLDDAYLRLNFTRVNEEDLDRAIYTLSLVVKGLSVDRVG